MRRREGLRRERRKQEEGEVTRGTETDARAITDQGRATATDPADQVASAAANHLKDLDDLRRNRGHLVRDDHPTAPIRVTPATGPHKRRLMPPRPFLIPRSYALPSRRANATLERIVGSAMEVNAAGVILSNVRVGLVGNRSPDQRLEVPKVLEVRATENQSGNQMDQKADLVVRHPRKMEK